MNNKQLYLAWLRTYAPSVYMTAVRRATGQVQTLGGLTDNLLQQALSPKMSHSFLGDDSSSFVDTTFADYNAPSGSIDNSQIAPTSIDFQTPTFDSSTVSDFKQPLNVQGGGLTLPSVSTPAASSNVFSNILTAVASIGTTVINATNSSKLISLNTTRATQGLPPINAAGQVVTAAGTTATGSALLAFERAISGGTTGSSMLPILAILGIGAFFVFSRRSAT
jgi:hypothetical protein